MQRGAAAPEAALQRRHEDEEEGQGSERMAHPAPDGAARAALQEQEAQRRRRRPRAQPGPQRGLLQRFVDDVVEEFEQFRAELKVCCGMSRDVPPRNAFEDPNAGALEDADQEFMHALERMALGKSERSQNSAETSSRKDTLDEVGQLSPAEKELSRRGLLARRSEDDASTNSSLAELLPLRREGERSLSKQVLSRNSRAENPAERISPTNSVGSASTAASTASRKHGAGATSVRRSDQETRLLEAVTAAEDAGDLRAQALANENLALYYCNAQGRPWKAVDSFLEAWQLLRRLRDIAAEATFLGEATCCMIKARRLDDAIRMAERRAAILETLDPASANEAQVWALDLRKRKARSGHLQHLLTGLDVERDVSGHEMALLGKASLT